MPYPEKLLADDEEVLAHLHPHWSTVFWPVVFGLLIVGVASFGMAAVPAGPSQGVIRLAVLALAVLLGLFVVAAPLLRWRSTHYVITARRLLWRTGGLGRRGRDIGLARIADVSFSQTLGQRVLRSGTLTVESAGETGALVFGQVPDCEGVAQLLGDLVEEDAERRAWWSGG